MCERKRERECVCVRERERERQVSYIEKEGERNECVFECVCVK